MKKKTEEKNPASGFDKNTNNERKKFSLIEKLQLF